MKREGGAPVALECGFRRVVIVVSASIVVLGAGLDIVLLTPRPDTATILVTLADGRQVTLGDVPRNAVPSQTDQAVVNKLAKELGAGEKAFDLRKMDSNVRQAVDRYSNLAAKIAGMTEIPTGFDPHPEFTPFLVQWWGIRRVEILREELQGRAWWWAQANVTPWAVGLAVLLWIAFYVVRWIACGFARG